MFLRKAGAVLLVSAIVAAAGDNSIKLVDRTDFRGEYSSDTTATPPNAQFDIPYLRVDFKGTITDGLKYRLRLRLDKTTVKDPLAGVSPFVNYAYVDKKFNDNFSVQLGKLWNYEAGWENDLSSSDVYIFSGMDDITNSYVVGVCPTFSFKAGDIHLVVANSGLSNEKSPKVSKYFNTVLAYQGTFGNVNPLLSIEIKPEKSGSKGELIADGGIKFDTKPFGGEADFGYWAENMNPDSLQQSLMSFSGTFRMTTGKFRPQVKCLYDIYTTGTQNSSNVFGIGPAIEYYPKNDNFRVHLAYTLRQTTPESGKSILDHKIYFGIKGSYSLL